MQMRKMMKRICASILLSLLLLPISVMAEDVDAEDLTDRCKVELDFDGFLVSALDGDTQTACTVYANRSMTVSWTDDVPAASVFFAFSGELTPYSILQYDADGNLLSEEAGPCVWNHLVKPMEETRRLTVRAGAENVRINTLAVFGEGEVPNYHPWAPTPEKLDYLLVAMHPDDDVLFLGGVIPIYGAEQGREGTALYMASRERRRVDEAMNGAWTMGLRNEPLFGGFRDIAGAMRSQYPHEFLDYQVAYYLVEQIRKYRPEVVVTQDLEGEYGHWQHRVMAKAVLEAVQHANDPAYHAASAKAYGTWEVKKLYIHLYPENKIALPVTEPLEAFGGKTAVEVATEAFECHASQTGKGKYAVTNEGVFSLSDFGLAHTTVGQDTPGVNDMFENIDPNTIRPTPTPTPTPAPSAEPTAAPTPAPSAETTASPSEEPTIEPTVEPIEEPTEPLMSALDLWIMIGCIAVSAISLTLGLILVRKLK